MFLGIVIVAIMSVGIVILAIMSVGIVIVWFTPLQ